MMLIVSAFCYVVVWQRTCVAKIQTKKTDGTQLFLSAFLVSLTDIIEDMFPGMPTED